ncbi:SRPBCC family protein [Halobacterium salinarum]|uniref:SRPBCC family protein n=1 Tax=Halobacterium salinarum TaxID=2242 RepID=UPI0025531A88|nr:SRPBCC family protein [Halobacterium salinarum]MDL0128011.1 SRPBCC family protein [Halobacterium salinarum]
MQTFKRDLRVDAPLESVWAFHSTVDGLLALTPEWANLTVEDVVWPQGQRDGDELVAGTRINMAVEPFGLGPRQTWTSVITERATEDDHAYFVDTMENGPFPEWEHTHSFYADGDQTVLRDRVAYEPPLGGLGAVGAPPVLWGMFRFRHRQTRATFGEA